MGGWVCLRVGVFAGEGVGVSVGLVALQEAVAHPDGAVGAHRGIRHGRDVSRGSLLPKSTDRLDRSEDDDLEGQRRHHLQELDDRRVKRGASKLADGSSARWWTVESGWPAQRASRENPAEPLHLRRAWRARPRAK